MLKRITLVVFLAATFSLGWQFYRVHQEIAISQKLYDEYRIFSCRMGPAQNEISRMQIEFFLILTLIGSRFKGLKHTLLSVVGLSGALIAYIFWWHYLFWITELADARIEVIPNVAYLAGGNYLDIAIAAGVVVLSLLNIRNAALSSFRVSTD